MMPATLSLVAALLLAPSQPLPLVEVTYALLHPPTEREEATLEARLPEWSSAYPIDRFAVPVAPPTAGGDLAVQTAAFARLAALVGRDRLVAVTPTVGTMGWEASLNPGYLPLGGRHQPRVLTQEEWLNGVLGLDAGSVALTWEGIVSEPFPLQASEYLDAWLAACSAAGRPAELWLPARLLMAKKQVGVLTALTPERVTRLARLVWYDVADVTRRPKPATPPGPTVDEDNPFPPSGPVQAVGATPAAASPAPSATSEAPDPAAEALASLLAQVLTVAPPDLCAGDLADLPRDALANVRSADEYLPRLRAGGIQRLVVRGRLDTPQDRLWQSVLAGLRHQR